MLCYASINAKSGRWLPESLWAYAGVASKRIWHKADEISWGHSMAGFKDLGILREDGLVVKALHLD